MNSEALAGMFMLGTVSTILGFVFVAYLCDIHHWKTTERRTRLLIVALLSWGLFWVIPPMAYLWIRGVFG